jgi:hypothetical protein
VWEGYAARLFISFGELTPSSYVLPSGRCGRPHGDIELTNMLSETSWVLTLNGHWLADDDSHVNRRKKALQRLVGKRLLALHIDQPSQSTVVEFSRGITLTTAAMSGSREHLGLAMPFKSGRLPARNRRLGHGIGRSHGWRRE